MWDSSWDPLVHVDYESHVFVDDDKGHLNPNVCRINVFVNITKLNKIFLNSLEIFCL